MITRYYGAARTMTGWSIYSVYYLGASGRWTSPDAIDLTYYEGPTQWLDNLLSTWPGANHAT